MKLRSAKTDSFAFGFEQTKDQKIRSTSEASPYRDQSEILDNFEIQMFKTFLEFRSFDIRICFEFRYSNFEFFNEVSFHFPNKTTINNSHATFLVVILWCVVSFTCRYLSFL
jgi:hypothetical protein